MYLHNLLTAWALSSLVSFSSAQVQEPQITTAPSNNFPKRDTPKSFGQEVVTVVNEANQTSTYTHNVLQTATADSSGNAVITIQPQLATAILSLYYNSTICSNAPKPSGDFSKLQPKKRDAPSTLVTSRTTVTTVYAAATPVTDSDGTLVERQNNNPIFAPHTGFAAAPPVCWAQQLEAACQAINPNDPLFGVLGLAQGNPAQQEATRLAQMGGLAFQDPSNGARPNMLPFYLMVKDFLVLQLVPEEQQQEAADFLGMLLWWLALDPQNPILLIGAASENVAFVISIQVSYRVSSTKDQKQSCPASDQKIPCEDAQCTGKNNKCTFDGKYKDCDCLNSLVADVGHFPTNDWTDTPKRLNDEVSGIKDDQALCFGSDSNTWVTDAAFSDAIKQFCQDSSKLNGGKNTNTSMIYGNGGDNQMELAIWWPIDQRDSPMKISQDNCTKWFGAIKDTCDQQNLLAKINPGNLKRGGAFFGPDDTSVPMFFVEPQVGKSEVSCNPHTNTYLTTNIGPSIHDAIQGFCKPSGQAGGASYASSNPYTQILNGPTSGGLPSFNMANVTMAWQDGTPVPSQDDCIKNFQAILDSPDCHVANGAGGDHFYGGNIAVGFASFSIAPGFDRTPSRSVRLDMGDTDTSGVQGGGGKKEQKGENGVVLEKFDLQQCLLQQSGLPQPYPEHSKDCGGVTFVGAIDKGWSDTSHCYNACVRKVSEWIDEGYSDAMCDKWAGATHCWLGYRIQ